ncbi:MAG: 4-hydroxy-tetrahydrodipicolinate synthase [Deltaproteobacteria bacterium]|nr:MAG: 4-hydroxy-tetrahydrodipicolinate synthase [Deltaproteobacteria bacterium]
MSDLRGSMVALVTPFRNGALDEPALRALVQWQLASGTDGLVPGGTTGEGATLTAEEAVRVARICVEEARGRVPVIAGCGTNSTRATIENVRRAKEAGADAALVVTPYYNKPTPEGLFRHFEAVAKQGGLPVVMYNVPSRTSLDMLPDTIARCARLPGIVAVKEASGNAVRVAEIRALGVPDSFSILAGDDMFTLSTLATGGQGVISVVANVAPADLAALCDAFFAGDLGRARAAQIKFAPLVKALFLETNPLPVKHALFRMGKIAHELRLPLVPISEAAAAKVDAAMRDYGGLL